MTKPARVLFVGDLNFYSKGASRLAALRQSGADVEAIPHTPTGGDTHGFVAPSLAFRVAWKFGIHLDSEQVNARLRNRVRQSPPHLLWIEKGNMIHPATLRYIRATAPATVIASYSDDDMFNPLNRTRSYAASLKYYDIVFTTKSYNADPSELPALGARRCLVVDKAYDPKQHFPIKLTDQDITTFGADVGFVGSFAPERAEVVEYLAANGIPVRVWGNGWTNYAAQSSNLRIEGRPLVNTTADLAFTKGICATRINLGFLRKINRDLQTDRSIEIPACGGFMLAERSGEHERLFEDGKEAVFFDSNEDLLAKIRYYMDHKKARRAIGLAGRARCETGDYSHAKRMQVMLAAASDGSMLS